MRQGGYAQIFYPDGNKESFANLNGRRVVIKGGVYETSTFTCHHCSTVVHVPPKADVNFVGMCRSCMKAICQKCATLPCKPFEQTLLEMEAKYHARRSYEAG